MKSHLAGSPRHFRSFVLSSGLGFVVMVLPAAAQLISPGTAVLAQRTAPEDQPDRPRQRERQSGPNQDKGVENRKQREDRSDARERQQQERAKAGQDQKQREDRARAVEQQQQERAKAGQDQKQREDRARTDERQQQERAKAGQERRPSDRVEGRVDRLEDLQKQRRERVEAGGKRRIIEEPDRRVIVQERGQTIIRHDELQRFSRLGRDVRTDRRGSVNISIFTRPGGIQVISETNDEGRLLRRYRRDQSGREIILIDNRAYYRRARRDDFKIVLRLAALRITIPRNKYVVDYSRASREDILEALTAPPVDRLERTYSLEEIRRSHPLRQRMPRVDLDEINFDFGSWDVSRDQLPQLERLANVIKSILERQPNEVFLIEGHTDAVGSDIDNLTLADRRAETVAVVLTEQFDVPPENLVTQGYGEQFLKVKTEEAERTNRRVAVRRITPLLSRGGEFGRNTDERRR